MWRVISPVRSSASPEPAPAVLLDQVSRVFRNGTQALSSVSLSVSEGEFVSIIGPSGCGKSTLLRLVAGLEPPDGGSLRVHAANRTEGRAVAFVFQQPTLMPWARVEDNVRLPLDLARIPRAVAYPRVRTALSHVGLADFASGYPRELSGGMQMRVSLARALVTSPSLLLMDEPFGALDEITRARLDGDLLELWRERSLTVLFVTHSLYEAVYLSTRVIVMSPRPGRIAHELTIDAPFPRNDAFRVSETFTRHCAELSAMLLSAGAS